MPGTEIKVSFPAFLWNLVTFYPVLYVNDVCCCMVCAGVSNSRAAVTGQGVNSNKRQKSGVIIMQSALTNDLHMG